MELSHVNFSDVWQDFCGLKILVQAQRRVREDNGFVLPKNPSLLLPGICSESFAGLLRTRSVLVNGFVQ